MAGLSASPNMLDYMVDIVMENGYALLCYLNNILLKCNS
jgi:hypothetical protein